MTVTILFDWDRLDTSNKVNAFRK